MTKDQSHRLRQLTRALRISLHQIKGEDSLSISAKKIARHAVRTYGLREKANDQRQATASAKL